MCLFKVNTGCREQEVCHLRGDWEVPVPELDTSVFIVHQERVKNFAGKSPARVILKTRIDGA